MKRSGKFYRKNEADVMRALGLNPTKNSGSGWIEKEDGQSDSVICQLKSTDAESIRIHKKDLDTLSYNAAVSHKLPVFAVQFIQSNEVYLLIKPDELCEVAKYIKTGEYTNVDGFIGIDLRESEDTEHTAETQIKTIKSSSGARERFRKFRKENEQKFKKGKRSAT